MKKKYDGKEVLTEVMAKMFSCVGATYTEESCKEPKWYLKHTWTEEQQEDFSVWLTNEYNTNPDKYSTMHKHPLELDSAKIKRLVWWFILNNGWETKEKATT